MELPYNDLAVQLGEFRKAIRAAMYFRDASVALKDLIVEEVGPLFEAMAEKDGTYVYSDGVHPPGGSDEGFKKLIKKLAWQLRFSTSEEWSLEEGEIYLGMELWPDSDFEGSPEESFSAVAIYGYRVDDEGEGKVGSYLELDFEFLEELTSEEHGFDEYANPLAPMNLTFYKNGWKDENDNARGEFAVACYDLSRFTSEADVKRILISDIKKLMKRWEA